MALHYAFVELMADIGVWLVLGILIAGTITYLVPASVMIAVSRHEATSLMAVLLFAVPLYVCATASTPIAAALVIKGLSPGAALVLLLAGPATNAATITVLFRTLGKRATLVYVATIAACSVLFGWLVNRLYETEHFSTAGWLSSFGSGSSGIIPAVAAITLLVLVAASRLAPLFIARWHRRNLAQGA